MPRITGTICDFKYFMNSLHRTVDVQILSTHADQ